MAVDEQIEEEPKEIKEPEGKLKPKAQPWHIVVASIMMLFYMLWLGRVYFGPPRAIHTKRMAQAEAMAWRVAEQAGPDADLSKVKQADRDEFLTALRGAPVNPRTILQGVWQAHHLSPKAKWQNFFSNLFQ